MYIKPGTPVKSAQVQTGVSILGTDISAAPTLTATKFKGLILTTSNLGVIVSYHERTVLVPYTNIVNLEVEPSAVISDEPSDTFKSSKR